jgi:hypothetical protein
MTLPDRRHAAPASVRTALVVAVGTAIALLIAACGPAASPSTSPLAAASPSASAPSSSPLVSASQSSSPVPSASAAAAATPSPAATASTAPSAPGHGAATCDLPQQANLRSDRVTDMSVTSTATTDTVTFVFGRSSLPGPASPPSGLLDATRPPFTNASSGEPIELAGEHALQVRFSGMSIANDVGEEVYTGPREVHPNGVYVRDVVLYDESEGVIGWYLSYDGDACVTMDTSGPNVTVTFDRS